MKSQITVLMLFGALAGVVTRQMGYVPSLVAWAVIGAVAVSLCAYAYIVSRIEIE